MIINATNLAELYVQYMAHFQKGFEMVEPQWQKIAMLIPSSTRENLYSFLGSAAPMREWLGPRQAKKLRQYDYRLVNKKFEGTLEISRDDIEDNAAADAGMAFQQLGASAALHPDEVTFPLLNTGDAATSLGYDGSPFFSATHPNDAPGGAVFSNFDTGAQVPWYLMALGAPMKPLIFQKRREYSFKSFMDLKDPRVWREDMFEFGVDARVVGGYGMWQTAFKSEEALTAANLEQYFTTMRRYTTDEGQPLKMNRPTHLVVPPELEFTANQLVSQNLVLDPTGVAAVDNPHRGRLQVIVSEFLDAS